MESDRYFACCRFFLIKCCLLIVLPTVIYTETHFVFTSSVTIYRPGVSFGL